MAVRTKVVGNDVYAGGEVIATLRDVNRFSDRFRKVLEQGLNLDDFELLAGRFRIDGSRVVAPK